MRMCTNNPLKNRRGMTLVEVILSIALLGIITAMAFLVFSTGILLAVNSGDNTEVTGNGSGILENSLGGATILPGAGNELQVLGETIGEGQYMEDHTVNATVKFSGINTKTIPGTFVTVYTESEKNNTTMAAFLPDAD